MRFPTSQQPSPGVGFGQDIAIMLSPATVAIGDCLAVDMTILELNSLGVTIPGSRFTTVRAVAGTDFATANAGTPLQTFMCIALDPATVAGTKIRCIFRGIPPGGALTTSATTLGVTRLQPTAGSAALVVSSAAAGTGNRIVGISLETNATASVVKQTLFNGIEGFGYNITNST